MLNERDWNSLRFSGSRLAVLAEWTLGAASLVFLGMAAAYLRIASNIARGAKLSLQDLFNQWLPGIKPDEVYSGSAILALEPLALALVCIAMFAGVTAFTIMFAVTRRRNRRLLDFLDTFQDSFTGTHAARPKSAPQKRV